MMSQSAVEALLVSRALARQEAEEEFQAEQLHGQIRGLVAVLKCVLPRKFANMRDLLNYMDIPFHSTGASRYRLNQQWLTDRGFVIDENGFCSLPTFELLGKRAIEFCNVDWGGIPF